MVGLRGTVRMSVSLRYCKSFYIGVVQVDNIWVAQNCKLWNSPKCWYLYQQPEWILLIVRYCCPKLHVFINFDNFQDFSLVPFWYLFLYNNFMYILLCNEHVFLFKHSRWYPQFNDSIFFSAHWLVPWVNCAIGVRLSRPQVWECTREKIWQNWRYKLSVNHTPTC